jgi:hypothetical protein
VEIHAMIVHVMPIVLDHVFVCTSAGAPAAERLRAFGLQEGPPNLHAGQGTACRRFFFRNGMLELLWVQDEAEARMAASTRLWERWSSAGKAASPFGVILRPAAGSTAECPFASWHYRPPAMPDLVLEVASETGIDEPMWCFHPQGRAPVNPSNAGEITGVRICCPEPREGSVTRAMAKAGYIALRIATEHRMEVELNGGGQGKEADFRPELPLVLRT